MTQTVGRRPEKIDVDVLAGEPVDFTVPVLDDDDVAQNVTGWAATAEVRRYPRGPLLASFTLTPGAAGVRVAATGAQTAGWVNWSSPVARWDLWVTQPDHEARPVAVGRVLVRSPISEA